MDTAILENIGLTGAEIKVFLALIELGSSSAGQVVEKAGLHNAVVHRAFHSLAEKGLITYVKQGKTKRYNSIEPRQLLTFIDEKKARLEKIIPQLEERRENSKNKPQAMIYEGVRGIKELIHLMISTDTKEYCAYGGPKEAHELLGDFFWENFHRKRIEKGIRAKLLFNISLGWWGDELNNKFSQTQVKITKKELEELTETIICGNRVAIIIYLDKPFGFLIEEENAAKSYRNFFQVLWKNS